MKQKHVKLITEFKIFINFIEIYQFYLFFILRFLL